MIARHAEAGNAPSPAAPADQLLGFVRQAADQGRPAHEVERAAWGWVLALGREAFALVLRPHGTGDVGDRMERSGMRWSKTGAQAMLDVRSEYLNGDRERFQAFRIRAETAKLDPHSATLDGISWPLAG